MAPIIMVQNCLIFYLQMIRDLPNDKFLTEIKNLLKQDAFYSLNEFMSHEFPIILLGLFLNKFKKTVFLILRLS